MDKVITLKQWKEMVEEARDSTGSLVLPSTEDLGRYTRDDLVKYIGSKGKRRVKSINEFFQ